MLVAVKNIHAREDVPGRTVPEVKDGQQRMLPVFFPGTGAEIPAATVERVTLMAFKGKLDAAFVQNILERRIDVVCERCPVTDVIEGFLRGGRFALAGSYILVTSASCFIFLMALSMARRVALTFLSLCISSLEYSSVGVSPFL